MEFKSMLNPHAREESQETGYKKTFDVYEDIVNNKTGAFETKKTDEINFYEKIQAQKESCELDSIIKRYSIDITGKLIPQVSDEIVDLSRVPTDLLDAYAMINKLEKLYADTSADFKNYFSDFGSFLKSVQQGHIASDLQEIAEKSSVKNKDIEKMKAESKKIEADLISKIEADRQAAATAAPNYSEVLGGNYGE